MVTEASGRYFINEGTIPVDGVIHPGTLFGIQNISYLDAGVYTCEARLTNSSNVNDWPAFARFELELNSKWLNKYMHIPVVGISSKIAC